jgi:hypothetical protein
MSIDIFKNNVYILFTMKTIKLKPGHKIMDHIGILIT